MDGKWELVVGRDNLDTIVYRPDGTKFEPATEVQLTVGVEARYVKIKYIDMESTKRRQKVVESEMTIPFDEFRLRYSL